MSSQEAEVEAAAAAPGEEQDPKRIRACSQRDEHVHTLGEASPLQRARRVSAEAAHVEAVSKRDRTDAIQ